MKTLAWDMPSLRNVWHPDPGAQIIICPNVSINVFVGEKKGQLNTGEFIEI